MRWSPIAFNSRLTAIEFDRWLYLFVVMAYEFLGLFLTDKAPKRLSIRGIYQCKRFYKIVGRSYLLKQGPQSIILY